MNSIKTVVHLCTNNYRRWGKNPRYYIIAILLVLWIHFLVNPILIFSQAVNTKVTPWGFPFILDGWYPVMIMLLGVVFLFCDAPFINSSTPYECVRSGKKHWVLGQLLYITTTSAFFVLFLVAISILCLVPNIYFSNEWGKVYNTLAQTNAGASLISIPISYKIILSYSPLGALLLTMLIMYLETIFIGLSMFILNMITNRVGGILAGLFFAFLPAFASVAGIPAVYYLTPTSWTNLNLIDVTGRTMYPSIIYPLCFLFGMIIILSFIILKIHKKREIMVHTIV